MKHKTKHPPVFIKNYRIENPKLCLNCTLPDCDENDIRCPFHPRPKIRKRKEHAHGHTDHT